MHECSEEIEWQGIKLERGRGHIMESQVKDFGFYPQYNEKPLKGFKQGAEIR